MILRPWNKEQDYPMLVQWWSAWKFPNPPIDVVPDQGGYIVEHPALGPVAAGFFMTLRENVPLGWVEWVVVNPAIDKPTRYAGLQFLFDELAVRAHKLGLAFLITFSDSARFVELLTNGLGFVATGAYTGCIRPLLAGTGGIVRGESDQVVQQEGEPLGEGPVLGQRNSPTSG